MTPDLSIIGPQLTTDSIIKNIWEIKDLKLLKHIRARLDVHLQNIESLDFQKRMKKSDRNSDSRKKREEELRPRLFKFVYNHLKPGMRIWVKGCRDGQGYREVLSVKYLNQHRDPSIECRQVHLSRKYKDGKWKGVGTEFVVVETLGQITEHYFDKIIGVDTRFGTSSWDMQIDKVQRMPIRKVLDHLGI